MALEEIAGNLQGGLIFLAQSNRVRNYVLVVVLP